MTGATLARLQSGLQDYLLRGGEAFAAAIAGDARADAGTRLGIYRDAYRLRLLEALETDYVALRAVTGDEEFDRIGRAYIDAHPSDHYSLRWFGRHLPSFLAAAAPWRDHGLLAELASFEWALTDAFDAPDAVAATVESMAAVPPAAWPGLTFGLHPSLRRINLRWNAPALWQAADSGEALPDPQPGEYPVGWMVWRHNLRIYFRSLGVEQAWMLDRLCEGASFAAVCEGLTEWIDTAHVAGHAAALLKLWLEDGLIATIQPSPA